MAIVTETLLNLIRTQIKTRGTVVWYDAEGWYADLAAQLQPQDVDAAAVQCYSPTRGFLWLRRAVEPLWGQAIDPPRLLLYVPVAPAATQQALVEFEKAGVVLRPGQQPPEHLEVRQHRDVVAYERAAARRPRVFRGLLVRIEPPLKMLLDDQNGEKHFLQNPIWLTKDHNPNLLKHPQMNLQHNN